MSQTVRTNLLTNGSFETGTSGWAGSNATLTTSTVASRSGGNSLKVTATTAAAFSVNTPTGTSGIPVTAGTSYAFQLQEEAAATSRTVTASISWYNSSGTLLSTSTGTGVADATTGFTQATVIAVAPAGAAFASLKVAWNTAAASEIHYVDSALFEASTVIGSYFDGSFTNAGGVMYAWTGTAFASTSTATTYVPNLSPVAGTTPCPNTQITITDLPPTDNYCNVWQTADGVRRPVPGAQNIRINGSTAVNDYVVPIGRNVAYDLEIVSGVALGSVVPTANITVPVQYDANGKQLWWIQDPMVPGSAIALAVAKGDNSHPTLTAAAVRQLEYDADMSIIPVLGSNLPIGIGGQRLAAANVPFDMFTNTAQATTNLRNLLLQTAILLIRPPGLRNNGIPGVMYTSVNKVIESPQTVAFGGTLTKWTIPGTSVAAPGASIVVPVWTYGSVAALWSTYQQAQTAKASKTYLDDLKSPSGT